MIGDQCSPTGKYRANLGKLIVRPSIQLPARQAQEPAEAVNGLENNHAGLCLYSDPRMVVP